MPEFRLMYVPFLAFCLSSRNTCFQNAFLDSEIHFMTEFYFVFFWVWIGRIRRHFSIICCVCLNSLKHNVLFSHVISMWNVQKSHVTLGEITWDEFPHVLTNLICSFYYHLTFPFLSKKQEPKIIFSCSIKHICPSSNIFK